MVRAAEKRHGDLDYSRKFSPMTVQTEGSATPRIASAGLVFLAITSVGWGLNWPIAKQILTEWPPLSARGLTGVAGGLLLAALAVMRGQSLRVPQGQWPRLLASAVLSITTWMTLMGLSLLWLPASEAAVLAYTMPVWASLLAWLILGERMSLARMLALLMAFAGIAALMGGNGINASMEKLPGIVMVLVGAFVFAIGTITAKRLPLTMPLIASTALQIGIGCLPVALAGLVFEHPRIEALSGQGWALIAYMTLIQFCVAYVCWFAAIERLPASVAAIGTLAVPVIGVIASAIALHEPLGMGQIGGLVFTLGGVALAARS
jgi:drug/metabolite transporter (DMT)-like permease